MYNDDSILAWIQENAIPFLRHPYKFLLLGGESSAKGSDVVRYHTDTAELIRYCGRRAVEMGHSYVGSAHFLLALSEMKGEAGMLLRSLGVESGIAENITRLLYGSGRPGLPLPQGLTKEARIILREASFEAKQQGEKTIRPVHVLMSMARREGCSAGTVMQIGGVSMNALFSHTVEYIRREKRIPCQEKGEVEMKLLERFSEDLIQKAIRLDPVIGRDAEIDLVIGILCRRSKNNPALVGEPGVGKTAIAEGLAQRMASGNVPPQLKNKRLISLNMADLVAGTKYRGEFEERLRDLLAEIKRSSDIILFVDEMHTIVGAGAAEGAIDASNIFKPALGRGELQILGATTREEYRRFIEKDAALDRRFRPVSVEEPCEAVSQEILKALKPGLEEHHRLRIGEDAIRAAVRLSVRYMPEQFLPDKAIDLLDEAASRVRMERISRRQWNGPRKELERELEEAIRDRAFEQAAFLRDKLQSMGASEQEKKHARAVTGADIANVVSSRTGIPVGKLTSSERDRILGLESVLSEKVIGQEEAVSVVAGAIRRGYSGVRDETRPIASLLFSGPTGVGKTELCRVLAAEVYGSKSAMIRLDMTEYMEKQSVSRLIGAPPGYVGYEEGGKLTEAVRRRSYSLVLLDEVEKAHPDVLGILLQIMEEGELTDSTGRKVSFRNAVVVMTCNVGGNLKSEGLGFCAQGRDEEMKDALRQYFTPEFLGRIDAKVAFRPLTATAMESVAKKYLAELCGRASSQGIHLSFHEDLGARLSGLCVGEDGARYLRRIVQTRVEGPLAETLLRMEQRPAKLEAQWDADAVRFV